ncbi:MAG: hypothetical protein OSB63_01535 [Planctomycetota bacterium]|nr:hypothetical protein [Planctomycetota bacterium]
MKIPHILLVIGALLCFSPLVISQEYGIADEIVIIKINNHLITSADSAKEARRLFHQNPLIDQDTSNILAINNLVRQALTLQAAAKLGAPLLAHYHSQAEEFVLKEIERAGSRKNFLLEKNDELGMRDREEFRDYIYYSFVHHHVMGVVAGNQPTAGNGLRTILSPSPAKIRRAYKERQEFRMAPAVLKWSYLRFYPKSNGAQTPEQIVDKALADLDDGSISLQELIDLADNAIPNVGKPEDTATWIVDFVSSASAGEYIIAPSTSIRGVAIVVITENVPVQEYTFEEAQPIIIKRLTNEKKSQVIDDFYAETAAMVDFWVTDDIPGLKGFVSQMIGRDIPANMPVKILEEL